MIWGLIGAFMLGGIFGAFLMVILMANRRDD